MANNYQMRKEQARQEAIEWQHESANSNVAYSELSWVTIYFSKIGKRYGLLKEFRENGIV